MCFSVGSAANEAEVMSLTGVAGFQLNFQKPNKRIESNLKIQTVTLLPLLDLSRICFAHDFVS